MTTVHINKVSDQSELASFTTSEAFTITVSEDVAALVGVPSNFTAAQVTNDTVTLSFGPPTDTNMDNGSYVISYKLHTASTYTTAQTIAYVTPNSGTFTDAQSNVWALNSSGNPVINTTVIDTVSHAAMMLCIGDDVWQIDTGGFWYSLAVTGTITTAPNTWSAPTTTSPLTDIEVSSLSSDTAYDFKVTVSTSTVTGDPATLTTTTTAVGGPGPSATSSFIVADFTTAKNYPNGGSGQIVVSPKLWGVVDGASMDDGEFGARGNNTNTDSFCAFTATHFTEQAAIINPGVWVFVGNGYAAVNTPWFDSSHNVNENAFANLIANFYKVDPLGKSSIMFGLDFTYSSNTTDYGTAIGNLAAYFYNGGAGRLMPNGKKLPVIGFVGHNEPDGYTSAQIVSYYTALKTAVKAVDSNYLIMGPQGSWWNGASISDFTDATTGIVVEGLATDNFFQGDGTDHTTDLWTNSNYADAFSGATALVQSNAGYTPQFLCQMGNMDSSCNCPAMANGYGAIWYALQAFGQIDVAKVEAWFAIWDSCYQNYCGIIDADNAIIRPVGYVMAQGVRKITGERWDVPTNAASLKVVAVTPSEGHCTVGVVNAGGSDQLSKTVAFSEWPVNTSGNGTATVWQFLPTNTGDGTTWTVNVTAGVTDAIDFPDASITIISV